MPEDLTAPTIIQDQSSHAFISNEDDEHLEFTVRDEGAHFRVEMAREGYGTHSANYDPEHVAELCLWTLDTIGRTPGGLAKIKAAHKRFQATTVTTMPAGAAHKLAAVRAVAGQRQPEDAPEVVAHASGVIEALDVAIKLISGVPVCPACHGFKSRTEGDRVVACACFLAEGKP